MTESTERESLDDDASVRLWHDDIRPAPEGWLWARTNNQAKHLLMIAERDGNPIAECSLDHDLGLDHFTEEQINANPELLFGRGQAEETGYDLVQWMIEENLVPGIIVIHSWNPAGTARMQDTLKSAGYGNVLVAPYTVPGTVLL